MNKYGLDFTIVDLGIGMRENIKKLRGLNLSPEKAIIWATEGATQLLNVADSLVG